MGTAVGRTVQRSPRASAGAQKAIISEYENMVKKEVIDMTTMCEWHDVRARAWCVPQGSEEPARPAGTAA